MRAGGRGLCRVWGRVRPEGERVLGRGSGFVPGNRGVSDRPEVSRDWELLHSLLSSISGLGGRKHGAQQTGLGRAGSLASVP